MSWVSISELSLTMSSEMTFTPRLAIISESLCCMSGSVGGGRPLSSSTEALKKMEAERRPLYLAAADAVIPNSGTVEDAVTAAMEALDEIFSH